VGVDSGVAGDSANVAADYTYTDNVKHHTIIDTIVVHDARAEGIGPML
jgi:hypothetical protein